MARPAARGHDGEVFEIKYSQDGKRLVSGSLDGTVKLWDTETCQPLKTFVGHTKNSVVEHRLQPGGRQPNRLLQLGRHREDLGHDHRGMVRAPLNLGPSLHDWDVAYSPDGTKLALPGSDGTVSSWTSDRG